MGRGVWTFSIWSAIAFASKTPTQIGRTRCPSTSRRTMIGMLVMGSDHQPLDGHLDFHAQADLPARPEYRDRGTACQ